MWGFVVSFGLLIGVWGLMAGADLMSELVMSLACTAISLGVPGFLLFGIWWIVLLVQYHRELGIALLRARRYN
jgi:hypothetical protein